MAIHACTITALCHSVIILAHIQQITLRLYLLGIGFMRGETIRHVPEGILDRLFILSDPNIPGYLCIVQIGPQAPRSENRHADARCEAPIARSTIEQFGQIATGTAGGAGQTYAWKERSPRSTYAGISRQQLPLRSEEHT